MVGTSMVGIGFEPPPQTAPPPQEPPREGTWAGPASPRPGVRVGASLSTVQLANAERQLADPVTEQRRPHLDVNGPERTMCSSIAAAGSQVELAAQVTAAGSRADGVVAERAAGEAPSPPLLVDVETSVTLSQGTSAPPPLGNVDGLVRTRARVAARGHEGGVGLGRAHFPCTSAVVVASRTEIENDDPVHARPMFRLCAARHGWNRPCRMCRRRGARSCLSGSSSGAGTWRRCSCRRPPRWRSNARTWWWRRRARRTSRPRWNAGRRSGASASRPRC
jgi:hypothetical protein